VDYALLRAEEGTVFLAESQPLLALAWSGITRPASVRDSKTESTSPQHRSSNQITKTYTQVSSHPEQWTRSRVATGQWSACVAGTHKPSLTQFDLISPGHFGRRDTETHVSPLITSLVPAGHGAVIAQLGRRAWPHPDRLTLRRARACQPLTRLD
jgi:hypothetical protein